VVGAIAAIMLACVLTIPMLSRIFQLAPPDGAWIVGAIVTAVIAGAWYGPVRRRSAPAPA